MPATKTFDLKETMSDAKDKLKKYTGKERKYYNVSTRKLVSRNAVNEGKYSFYEHKTLSFAGVPKSKELIAVINHLDDTLKPLSQAKAKAKNAKAMSDSSDSDVSDEEKPKKGKEEVSESESSEDEKPKKKPAAKTAKAAAKKPAAKTAKKPAKKEESSDSESSEDEKPKKKPAPKTAKAAAKKPAAKKPSKKEESSDSESSEDEKPKKPAAKTAKKPAAKTAKKPTKKEESSDSESSEDEKSAKKTKSTKESTKEVSVEFDVQSLLESLAALSIADATTLVKSTMQKDSSVNLSRLNQAVSKHLLETKAKSGGKSDKAPTKKVPVDVDSDESSEEDESPRKKDTPKSDEKDSSSSEGDDDGEETPLKKATVESVSKSLKDALKDVEPITEAEFRTFEKGENDNKFKLEQSVETIAKAIGLPQDRVQLIIEKRDQLKESFGAKPVVPGPKRSAVKVSRV